MAVAINEYKGTAWQAMWGRGECLSLAARILTFLDEPIEIALVSKAFNQTVRHSMIAVRQQIISGNEQLPPPPEAAPSLMQLLEKIEHRTRRIARYSRINGPWPDEDILLRFTAAAGTLHAFFREIFPVMDEQRTNRCHAYAHKLNRELVSFYARILLWGGLARREHMGVRLRAEFGRWILKFRRFHARERVTWRYQQVNAGKDGDAFNGLKRLHDNQEREAMRSLSGKRAFHVHNGGYSFIRLCKMEEAAVCTVIEEDCSLRLLWSSITSSLPAVPHRVTTDKRAWMHENPGTLAEVEGVNLNGCEILPSELKLLPNLRKLLCEGSDKHHLLELPEWAVELRNLRVFNLSHNNFPAVPPVLARLDSLWSVNLYDNRTPIRVLPDAFAQAHCSGFISHFWEAFEGTGTRHFFKLMDGKDPWEGAALQYACLKPSDFTDIPFSVWFRDKFSLPYLPLAYPILGLAFLGTGAGLLLSNAIEALFGGDIIWAVIMTPIGIAGLIPLLALCLAGILLNMPIYLANLFINLGIQPIVSYIRSKCGYPPMVHL